MNDFQAQFIAQSIGQAFQVAYMEFLKANGIEDHSFVKEMDYQEVLNSQEIFGDELAMFAKKELQKEVSQSNHVQSKISDYLRQASPLDVFLPSRDFKNAEKLSFNLEF